VASYIPDDEQGQYDAVKALLAAGYRHPLCLPASQLATSAAARGWSAPAGRRVSNRTI
jgi:DNA-binding LacI/PurR family transcriptional regulator